MASISNITAVKMKDLFEMILNFGKIPSFFLLSIFIDKSDAIGKSNVIIIKGINSKLVFVAIMSANLIPI